MPPARDEGGDFGFDGGPWGLEFGPTPPPRLGNHLYRPAHRYLGYMVSRVLVPMDGSEMATRALEYALDVHADADLTVLYVAGEPSPMMWKALNLAVQDDVRGVAEDVAAEVFESARETAAEHGVEVDTEVAVGHPAKVIVERAADHDAVVLGSHGGDLQSRLFVGNVAETVTRRSPVPVTVVR